MRVAPAGRAPRGLGAGAPRYDAGMAGILTVGHGDLEIGRLIGNLRAAGVERLVDVRSVPRSRRFPQHSQPALEAAAAGAGIAYEWAPALGGRPSDPSLLTDGRPDYGRMARTDGFREALAALVAAAGESRTAILCSEGRPEQCHRTLLVARALMEEGVRVRHLLKDRTVIDVPLPVAMALP